MKKQSSTHLPAEERRAMTVEAVIDLAAEQNPSDITTSDIAKRMDLTQGALFRHFPTKDALFQEVMAWVSDHLLARILRAAEGASSPVVALEAMFTAHVKFVVEHPGVPRMLFGQLQQPGETMPKQIAGMLLQKYGKQVRHTLETARAQGAVDADLDIDAAAVMFIGTIQGLVLHSLLTGKPTQIRRDAPGVFALYLRGIGAAR